MLVQRPFENAPKLLAALCQQTTFSLVIPHGLTVASEAATQAEVQAQRCSQLRVGHSQHLPSTIFVVARRTEDLRNDIWIICSVLDHAKQNCSLAAVSSSNHVKSFAVGGWLMLTIPCSGFRWSLRFKGNSFVGYQFVFAFASWKAMVMVCSAIFSSMPEKHTFPEWRWTVCGQVPLPSSSGAFSARLSSTDAANSTCCTLVWKLLATRPNVTRELFQRHSPLRLLLTARGSTASHRRNEVRGVKELLLESSAHVSHVFGDSANTPHLSQNAAKLHKNPTKKTICTQVRYHRHPRPVHREYGTRTIQ